jgi:hypothetical protein
VVEQQVPGRVATEDEEDARGLPDAWLYDIDADWALMIESKVSAAVGADQLRRHLATAELAGYSPVCVLLITTGIPRGTIPKRVVSKTWAEVYAWFIRQSVISEWAWRFADYLRAAEARLVAEGYLMSGTLTRFDGFHFTAERPYTAREGRRLIRLMREELLRRPDIRSLIDHRRAGRPAITGRGASGVWDFMCYKHAVNGPNFTASPHMTFGIHTDHVEVAVTLPNGLRSEYRRRLVSMSADDFNDIMGEVAKGMETVTRKAPGASPRIRVNQRHFASQNSVATNDAALDFDLRTAFPVGRGRVKHQPQWLNAALEVMKRRRSNIQFQAWLRVPYAQGVTDSREILDIVAHGWLACRPLMRAVVGR